MSPSQEAEMRETLSLLRRLDTVHGSPAEDAARRLEAALEDVSRIHAENNLHRTGGVSCST